MSARSASRVQIGAATSHLFARLWDLVLERLLGHYRISGGVISRQAGLRKTDVVLDVGGGTGGVSAQIADAVRAVIVLEPSAGLAARGRDRFPGLRFARGDGRRLPIRDGSVDVVLLVEVLHHVADADAILRESARVLRPGGRILIEEVEFLGPGGWLGRRLEALVSAGVWPRDRAGLCARLVGLGMRPTVLEQEGFVILAA